MKTRGLILRGLSVCLLTVGIAGAQAIATPQAQTRKTGWVVAQLNVNFTHVYGLVYDQWHENGDPKAPVVPSWQVDDSREDSGLLKFVDFEVPSKGRLFLDGMLKADAKYGYFLWGDNNPYVAAWDPAGKRWWLFPGGPANWTAIVLQHGAEQSEIKLSSSTPTVKPAGGLLPNEGAACGPGKYRLVVKAPRSPDWHWRYPMSGMLRVWFVPDEGEPVWGRVEAIVGAGTAFNRTRHQQLRIGDTISFGDEIETTEHCTVKLMMEWEFGKGWVQGMPGTRMKWVQKLSPQNKQIPGVFLFMGGVLSIFSREERTGDGYSVETPNFVCGCEGTAFDVRYDPATKSAVCTVVDGRVSVSALGSEKRLLIRAGQRVTVKAADPPIVENAPADELTRLFEELEKK